MNGQASQQAHRCQATDMHVRTLLSFGRRVLDADREVDRERMVVSMVRSGTWRQILLVFEPLAHTRRRVERSETSPRTVPLLVSRRGQGR